MDILYDAVAWKNQNLVSWIYKKFPEVIKSRKSINPIANELLDYKSMDLFKETAKLRPEILDTLKVSQSLNGVTFEGTLTDFALKSYLIPMERRKKRDMELLPWLLSVRPETPIRKKVLDLAMQPLPDHSIDIPMVEFIVKKYPEFFDHEAILTAAHQVKDDKDGKFFQAIRSNPKVVESIFKVQGLFGGKKSRSLLEAFIEENRWPEIESLAETAPSLFDPYNQFGKMILNQIRESKAPDAILLKLKLR